MAGSRLGGTARAVGAVLLLQWFLTSVLLGRSALIIDYGLLSAASTGAGPGLLVDQAVVVAAALSLSVTWLLTCWTGIESESLRRRTVAANALVAVALAVVYATLRVDVLLVDDTVFGQAAVRAATLLAASVSVITTLLSAVAAAVAQSSPQVG